MQRPHGQAAGALPGREHAYSTWWDDTCHACWLQRTIQDFAAKEGTVDSPTFQVGPHHW